jgi:hypothetical protein
MSHQPDPSAPAPARPVLTEVKYSLSEMLEELKAERSTGALTMEKVDQNEIGKLFKPKAPRSVKSK